MRSSAGTICLLMSSIIWLRVSGETGLSRRSFIFYRASDNISLLLYQRKCVVLCRGSSLIRIISDEEILLLISRWNISLSLQLILQQTFKQSMPISQSLTIAIAYLFFVNTICFEFTVKDPVFIHSQQAKGGVAGTVAYEPNVSMLPANSTITKIQMSIGQYIDGFVIHLTSPNGSNFTFSGLGFATRAISDTYNSPPGNMIKQIYLASKVWSDGHKNFCAIQFKGTKEDSPFYGHNGCPKGSTHYETIYTFGDNPVAFYGHLHLSYRTIYGFGMVMEKIT